MTESEVHCHENLYRMYFLFNSPHSCLIWQTTVNRPGSYVLNQAFVGLFALLSLGLITSFAFGEQIPESLNRVIENHCVDCHDDVEAKGKLDRDCLPSPN